MKTDTPMCWIPEIRACQLFEWTPGGQLNRCVCRYTLQCGRIGGVLATGPLDSGNVDGLLKTSTAGQFSATCFALRSIWLNPDTSLIFFNYRCHYRKKQRKAVMAHIQYLRNRCQTDDFRGTDLICNQLKWTRHYQSSWKLSQLLCQLLGSLGSAPFLRPLPKHTSR